MPRVKPERKRAANREEVKELARSNAGSSVGIRPELKDAVQR